MAGLIPKTQALQSLQALKWCSSIYKYHSNGRQDVLFDLKLLQLIFNADIRSRLKSEKQRGPTNSNLWLGATLQCLGRVKAWSQ